MSAPGSSIAASWACTTSARTARPRATNVARKTSRYVAKGSTRRTQGARQRGAAAEAVEPLLTGTERDELDDRHLVSGGGERRRLAAHT